MLNCYTLFTLLYVFTSLRIGSFHFQAGGCKKQTNLGSPDSLFCVLVCFVTDEGLLFIVLDLVFRS